MKKVIGHENELVHYVLGRSVLSGILQHILSDKFKKSPESAVSEENLDRTKLEELLRQIDGHHLCTVLGHVRIYLD